MILKCDECLPILEEYLDGELEEQQSETVSAHLAACPDCACAFEALRDEQEMYAHYQRDIEVTPALWQAVRARIEQTPDVLPQPQNRPLLARLRERVAAVLALPALNPALAGSFALVALAVTAGVIWYAQEPRLTTTNTPELARDVRPDAARPNAPAAILNNAPDSVATMNAPVAPSENLTSSENRDGVAASPSSLTTQVARERQAEEFAPGRAVAFVAARERAGVRSVAFNNNHAVPAEDALLAESPVAIVRAGGTTPAPLLTADDEEISRHIEKAQLLLRSFRNANYAEGASATDVAYEKRISSELLNENILLRRDAATEGNTPTAQLLSTLEPFLLDISNLHDQPSKDDVRSIQERMRKREIIAALQVY
ncbi:MAG TPA: zf-HC2 domain-containing protein [Pyrinomonadaceae bacterium]|jgi:anti-sigma factor RsiW|nr:zf-HC2 domain-containing protein [Pyrinomonadaceae bacterium]